jgi:hypothetical protein
MVFEGRRLNLAQGRWRHLVNTASEASNSITGSAFIDWATQCPVLEELRLSERLVSTHFGSPEHV